MDLQEGLLTFGTKWLMAGCSEVHTTCSERCFHIPPRQRGAHGCGGGNADCDFQPRRRQKRTESGLSERQFELKSFTIIIARNRTGSRRKLADWERTERARRDSANCFEMVVARDGVEPPPPAFSALFFNNLTLQSGPSFV